MNLLAEAEAAGLSVRVDGDRLMITGPRRAGALAQQLIDHKAEVFAALSGIDPSARSVVDGADTWKADVKTWDEGRRVEYEERAAIMEHDGRLPRREAERRAYQISRKY